MQVMRNPPNSCRWIVILCQEVKASIDIEQGMTAYSRLSRNSGTQRQMAELRPHKCGFKQMSRRARFVPSLYSYNGWLRE